MSPQSPSSVGESLGCVLNVSLTALAEGRGDAQEERLAPLHAHPVRTPHVFRLASILFSDIGRLTIAETYC